MNIAPPGADFEPRAAIRRRPLAIAVFALILIGVLLTIFEYVLLRTEFTRSADTLANVTGIHSAASVVFRDAVAARETLAALTVLPHLEAVAIFTTDGERLAGTEREGQKPIAGPTAVGATWLESSTSAPILADGKWVGTIVARFELMPLYERVAAFAGMYLLAGAGVLAIGLPLWRRMRKQIEVARVRLERLAHHDPTTGQLNRNAFNRDLAISLDRCPAGAFIGLFILDIDDFKDTNDRFGHHTGDDLLNQFADRLHRAVRANDRIYRLGGDEFAVLLHPVSCVEEVELMAAHLYAPFAKPIALHGHWLQASFSVGVSIFPEDAHDMKTLVAHADTAMYDAKQFGKNNFRRFEPRMTESTLRRLRLQEDLRAALDADDHLALVYQPQMSGDGTRIVGMEALLRWEHPLLGTISPAEFIPLAEDCGLIVALGRWVICAACAQAALWNQAGHADVRMAINVSARQMQDRGLLSVIDRALTQSKLPPHALEIEITESLLLEDAEANMQFMHALRARGIGLAVDDFGKGYSSMSYLHKLPVNRLKIDMSFVHDIPGGGEAITVAIIAMAHSLGLTVIAEGVETRTQLNFLRSAGCDGLQGYLFSRPLSPGDASALLDEQRGRGATDDDVGVLPRSAGFLRLVGGRDAIGG
jgi:diguanylate cyclase (GGDEF)-like protein